MNNKTYYRKQLIGLIITALSLQGILSLLGYWGFFSPIFLWVVRVFLIVELVYGIYHYLKNENKPLPWIGKYAEKLF